MAIAVRATGISPFDHQRAQGMVGPGESLPPRLGHEASGVVVAAGELDGQPLCEGDEVFGQWLPGAQASQTCQAAVPLPSSPAASARRVADSSSQIP